MLLTTLCHCPVAHGQEYDRHAITHKLNVFRRGSPDRFSKEITRGGPIAVDCIMDFIEASHPHYGSLHKKGVTPTARFGPLKNLGAFFDLLRSVNAPYPVDRLAVLVEKGMGPANHRSALNSVLRLLAESGHDRARMLITHHHKMALQSRHPIDADWANVTSQHLLTWERARKYITTGEGLNSKPPAALTAVRKAYTNNSAVIHWEVADWNDYLGACLRNYGPHISDSTNLLHTNRRTFGQFYQPLLVPALETWINGDMTAMVEYFGDEFPDEVANQLSFLEPIISGMASEIAFTIKMRILDETSIVSDGLLNYSSEKWLPQVLELAGVNSQTAAMGLSALASLDRPLTNEELEHLRLLLISPSISFHWLGSDVDRWTEHASVLKLAKVAPDVFRNIISEQQLSRQVVDAIMSEHLFEDRNDIYRLIETGLGFNAEPPVHYDEKWLILIPKHFVDVNGVSVFLQYARRVRSGRRAGLPYPVSILTEYGTRILPAITEHLETEKDDEMRLQLANAATRFGRLDEELIEFIGNLRDDPDLRIREIATNALKRLRY